jgi:hypothetical protein
VAIKGYPPLQLPTDLDNAATHGRDVLGPLLATLILQVQYLHDSGNRTITYLLTVLEILQAR